MKIKRGAREFVVREFGSEALGGEFYRLSGWFFASGQVRTELGTAMTVTPGDWWFVLCGDETSSSSAASVGLCGCGVNKAGTMVTVKYVYVVNEHKDTFYEPFLDIAMKALAKRFPTAAMQTTCHESAVALYARHGFKEQSRRGQYVKLVRQGSDAA